MRAIAARVVGHGQQSIALGNDNSGNAYAEFRQLWIDRLTHELSVMHGIQAEVVHRIENNEVHSRAIGSEVDTKVDG